MKNQTTLFFLCMLGLVLSCQEATQVNEEPVAIDTVQVSEQDTVRAAPATSPPLKEPRTIREIIACIDTLYQVDRPLELDTIQDFKTDIPVGRQHEMGPRGLDLTKAEAFLRYYFFTFIVFEDRESAQAQFDRLLSVSDIQIQDQENPDRDLFLKWFSKSGSSYTLYGNTLIYHWRQCSYNEKVELPREDRLLAFLFHKGLPESTYFVRVRCGWSNHEAR